MPDQIIEIKNPITLDLRKDGSAPSRKENEMQVLKNYIPKLGEIYTRLGISLFTYTPSTTASAWSPITCPLVTLGGETAVCVAVFEFNDTATMGINAVDGLGVFTPLRTTIWSGWGTTSTIRSKHGPASFFISRDTVENPAAGNPIHIYGMRSNNAFPSYFPGDSGGATNCFLITYWIYPTTATNATNAAWHWIFGNNTDLTHAAFGIRHFDTNLQMWVQSTSGGTLQSLAINSIMAENQWQFIACWYDGRLGAYGCNGLYHYNDVTKVETYTAETSGGNTTNFYKISSSICLGSSNIFDGAGGGRYTENQGFEGNMDYTTLWNAIFSVQTNNITLIRQIRDLHAS